MNFNWFTDLSFERMLTYIAIGGGFFSMRAHIAQKVNSWYISMILCFVHVVYYWTIRAYDQAVTRLISFCVMCYGVYQWLAHKEEHPGVMRRRVITRTSLKTAFYLMMVGVVSWFLLHQALITIKPYIHAQDGREPIPNLLLSSFLSVGIFMGQWLGAHKKVESQLFWVFYNLLQIIYHAFYLDSLLYVKHLVYLPFCFYGFSVWWGEYKKEEARRSYRNREEISS